MARPDNYRFVCLERHVDHDFDASASIGVSQARIDQFAEAPATINGSMSMLNAPGPKARLAGRWRMRGVLQGVEARGAGRKLLRVSGTVDIEGGEKPALVGVFLALVQG